LDVERSNYLEATYKHHAETQKPRNLESFLGVSLQRGIKFLLKKGFERFIRVFNFSSELNDNLSEVYIYFK
jgi:hypothetical protein